MDFSLLNELLSDSVLSVLLAALWKSSSLVVLTALTISLFPKASASIRSWLWALCLLALELIPIAELMPAWRMPLLPAFPAEAANQGEPAAGGVSSQLGIVESREEPAQLQLPSQRRETVQQSSSVDSGKTFLNRKIVLGWLPGGLLLAWLAGGMATILGWFFSWYSTRKLIRGGKVPPRQTQELMDAVATSAGLSVTPRLLLTSRLQSPAVAGLLRPVVLLPRHTLEWSRERLCLVIRHELEHISRYDSLLQLAARVSCSIYWFNPLVWKANLAMHREREKACDDAVLSTGVRLLCTPSHCSMWHAC